MTQPDLLDLAKQGNPKAIAARSTVLFRLKASQLKPTSKRMDICKSCWKHLKFHLEFRNLTIFYIGVQAVSLTVMVILDWFNKSVLALIVGGLVTSVFQLLWSHRLIPEIRYCFFWEKAVAKSIFSFGKWNFSFDSYDIPG